MRSAYLRMLVFKDDLSFRRIVNVPKRNLGKRRLAFLEETAERENTSLYEGARSPSRRTNVQWARRRTILSR